MAQGQSLKTSLEDIRISFYGCVFIKKEAQYIFRISKGLPSIEVKPAPVDSMDSK